MASTSGARSSTEEWGLLESHMPDFKDTVLTGTEVIVTHLSLSKSPNSHLAFIENFLDIKTFVNNYELQKNKKYMLFDNDVIFLGDNRVKMFCFKMKLCLNQESVFSSLLPKSLTNLFAVDQNLEHNSCKTSFVVFDKVSQKAYFLKELKLSAHAFNTMYYHTVLKHPFLMPSKPLFKEGRLFLVTKYLRESNLESWMSRGMVMDDIKFAFIQMVLAIQYLHETIGIHHGRLNPANIFITKPQNSIIVKISDYGLPKMHEKLLTEETPFIAPEVADGHVGPSQKSDIWSLGEIFSFMIYGKNCFSGKDRLFQIVRFNICNYFGLNGNVEGTIRNLLAGMMNVNIEDRLSVKKVINHKWFRDERKQTLM